MNLKQFANVDSMYRDLDTGLEVPWDEYMSCIIEKLGLENIKPYIPFDLDYLKEKLKTDIHLNNTKMYMWDRAAGFDFHPNGHYNPDMTPQQAWRGWGIAHLYRQNGITTYSCSDGVCILKTAARMLCGSSDAE